MISPVDLGAPRKFDTWRRGQYEALQFALDSERRFVMMQIPTGIGKSLIYSLLAKITKLKTVICTVSRPLQDQIWRDFKEMGMVDVRGQQNYPCLAVQKGGELHHKYGDLDGVNCDHGPCHIDDIECGMRYGGCLYFDAVRTSRNRSVTITNYAWWLNASKASQQGGIIPPTADLLVLDEAHAAPEQLSRAVTIGVSNEILNRHAHYDCVAWDLEEWRAWADSMKKECEVHIASLYPRFKQNPRRYIREIREYQTLYRQVGRMREIRGNWIPEVTTDRGLELTPVFPRHEAEAWLFRGAKRVLFTSATNHRKTAHQLGVRNADLDYFECGSEFPVGRRPIYSIPSVRLNHHSTEEDYRIWTRQIDKVRSTRLDRKAILHTVSYSRARKYRKMTNYSSLSLTHVSGGLQDSLQKFMRCSPGTMLISPAISTGYDFPYSAAELNVIGKVNFPDTRSRLMRERIREDRDYDKYLALQDLQQAAGRIVRAADDQGENIIADESVRWFMRRYGFMAAEWFREAYREVAFIPQPLPRLVVRTAY